MKYSAPFKKVWIELDDGSMEDISDVVAGMKYVRDVEKDNVFTHRERRSAQLQCEL